MSTLKSEMRDDLADNHSVFHSVTERLLVPAASSPDPEEKHVAFYAYMTSSMVNPGSHQILKFDHVKTNIGHGYHNNTGVFIAPTSGFLRLFVDYPDVSRCHTFCGIHRQ